MNCGVGIDKWFGPYKKGEFTKTSKTKSTKQNKLITASYCNLTNNHSSTILKTTKHKLSNKLKSKTLKFDRHVQSFATVRH
jgi:hypothetical protein